MAERPTEDVVGIASALIVDLTAPPGSAVTRPRTRTLPVERGRWARLIENRAIPLPVVEVGRRDTIYCMSPGSGQGRSIYFIERGFVKAVTPSRNGKDCLLGVYSHGDLIGDLSLGGADTHESAIAMVSTKLYRLSSVDVRTHLAHEDFRVDYLCYLSQRIIDQQQMIIDLVTTNSEYRFGALLMNLAGKIGNSKDGLTTLGVRITQEEFAAMVGTTRSRVGLFLRNFLDCGAVVRRHKGVLAVDRARMTSYLTSIC